MLQDPVSGYECVAPQIGVTITYVPVVIYIGREFPPGTCAYDEILKHELRHLKTYMDYLPRVEEAGLIVAARTPTEDLCEIMELPREGANAHPWYMGVQYHPEFKSTPRDGHPLFKSFIEAALAHKGESRTAANNGASEIEQGDAA